MVNNKFPYASISFNLNALVIVQPTKCGVQRLVAAFRNSGDESPHSTNSSIGLNDDQGQQDKD